MNETTTVGIDLAKAVFSVQGVDSSGGTALRKAVRREKVMEFMASLPQRPAGLERQMEKRWAAETTAAACRSTPRANRRRPAVT